MFALTLLMGSLILFNCRESEDVKLATEAPVMELVDLQVELCSIQTNASPVLSYWLNPVSGNRSVSGKPDPLIDLNLTELRIRIKRQIEIHLELKPLIADQSGQNIQNRSRCDDPPLS